MAERLSVVEGGALATARGVCPADKTSEVAQLAWTAAGEATQLWQGGLLLLAALRVKW